MTSVYKIRVWLFGFGLYYFYMVTIQNVIRHVDELTKIKRTE